MKRFLTAILAILVVGGCNAKIADNQSNTPINPVANVQIPLPDNYVFPNPQTPDLSTQIYKNLASQFQFSYPKEMAFTDINYANLDQKIVQLVLPKSVFPKTNFDDAGFAVSTGAAQSLAKCLAMNLPEGNQGFPNLVVINGIKFYQGVGSGAGAGNFYESKVYRTFVDSKCLEITETVHTANIGNFSPGTVTEINKDKVWEKLNNVLNSFEFLPSV